MIAPLRIGDMLERSGVRHFGVDLADGVYVFTTTDTREGVSRALANNLLPIVALEFDRPAGSECWVTFFTLEDDD